MTDIRGDLPLDITTSGDHIALLEPSVLARKKRLN
jgi:hypothetical protein